MCGTDFLFPPILCHLGVNEPWYVLPRVFVKHGVEERLLYSMEFTQ